MCESKIVEYQQLIWNLTGLSENVAKTFPITGEKTIIESEIYRIFLNGKVTEISIQIHPNFFKENFKEKGTKRTIDGSRASPDNGHVGLFLNLKKKMSNNFDTTFKFGISCEKKDYVTGELKMSKKEWEAGSVYGFAKWINHAKLFNPENEYFTAGTLTIFCDVKISIPLKTTVTVKLDKAIEVFSKMFITEDFKDCELHTSDGIVLKCHKPILAARSPVFEAMFASGMNEVKIKDFDSKTIDQLLRFAYCLDVEGLDIIAGDLILAAEEYEIKELKEMCVNSLIVNLNQDNVFDSLIITEKISESKNLLDDCLKIIKINYKVLSKTAKWRELPQPVALKIIEYTMSQSSNNNINSTTI